MRRAALVAVSVLGVSAAAWADGEKRVPGLAGDWAFKSWTYDDCEFSGVARFWPSGDPAKFDCELTANQSCTGFGWTVRQSCVAHQTGDRVTVTSTIEEFLDGTPTENYWPDNFILTIHSPSRMSGSLVSHGVHPTEFTRKPGATS